MRSAVQRAEPPDAGQLRTPAARAAGGTQSQRGRMASTSRSSSRRRSAAWSADAFLDRERRRSRSRWEYTESCVRRLAGAAIARQGRAVLGVAPSDEVLPDHTLVRFLKVIDLWPQWRRSDGADAARDFESSRLSASSISGHGI